MSDGITVEVRADGGPPTAPTFASTASQLALYREVFAHSNDGIAVIDLDGRYLLQNAAHAALVGYSDAELAGRTPALHLGEEVFARIAEELRRTGRYRGEARSRGKGGVERLIEISAFPVLGPDGDPMFYVGIKRDVTGHRQEEEELRRRFDELQLLHGMTEAVGRASELDQIHEQALDCLELAIGAQRASILRFDDAGVMRFVAWRGLSDGYRRVVEGHSPWDRGAVDPLPIAMDDVALDPGLPDELRDTVLGEGIGALAFIPLLHQGDLLGKFMVYFDEPHAFSDEELRLAGTVASQVAFALARHSREESLRVANEAKSRFLAMVSHELRTPLNAILGYADLLDLGTAGELNPGQAGQLGRIRAGAKHLMGVIEEILTFSRVDAGQETVRLETTDVGELVKEAADMVRPATTQKGLDLRVRVPSSPLHLETDRGKLRQILLNLLANAVKFTDRGGIDLAVAGEGGAVTFTVGDTGVGIDGQHLGSIFEPFWQVDAGPARPVGGTGLGLAVTRHLVELLGGEVRVESEPGAGSTFTVSLDPRKASEAKRRKASEASVEKLTQ